MSAPLVVNTRDGVCWTRRTVTSGGIALYAPESVKTCPRFVMATIEELAGHGIVGSADVLPVPPGPERRSRGVLDRARDAVDARMSKDALRHVLQNVIDYAARLENRVAELEAAQENPLAFAEKLDAKSLDNFLIALASATEHEPQDAAIARVHKLISSYREGGDAR